MAALRPRRIELVRTLLLVLGLMVSGRAHVVLHGGGESWDDQAQHVESVESGGGCTLCHLGSGPPPVWGAPLCGLGAPKVSLDPPAERPFVVDVRGGSPPRGPPATLAG